MLPTRSIRRVLAAAGVTALAAAAVAQASDDRQSSPYKPGGRSTLFATTDQNQLISFGEHSPSWVRSSRPITGLPAGVSLVGIDFRPATGDLYGVGSDSVVYRVNPHTAIAVAEGPAFTPALSGTSFGVDFNPTVDKIRVTSDAQSEPAARPRSGHGADEDAGRSTRAIPTSSGPRTRTPRSVRRGQPPRSCSPSTR